MRHSVIVIVPSLRVNGLKREWWIDLPELTSIRFRGSAFCFKSYYDSTELIMRSGYDEMNWWIDLPKLTTLTTEGWNSCTFEYPCSITLEGISYHSISPTDMPSLTTVTLDKKYVFNNKKNVQTKSSSPSPPSFLDITPALQYYLQFIVSFTRHSHPNTKSPFSLHTTITHFLSHYHSFYSSVSKLCHAAKCYFTPSLSFHSYSGDQTKCCIL